MSDVVVSEFVSVDGVMEDPRWTFEFDRVDDGDEFITEPTHWFGWFGR